MSELAGRCRSRRRILYRRGVSEQPERTSVCVADSLAAYELAHDEARRALDKQERDVTELRSRSGVVVAAAAITTSFFGGRVLITGHTPPWGWVALVAFAILGISVLYVLWPRDWRFTVSAEGFIELYLEPEDAPAIGLAEIHRELAIHGGQSWKENNEIVRHLTVAIRVAITALLLEVVAWVIALAQLG